MIFVTVGAQMPFDRLTKAVDRWAGERGRSDVFMQTGETSWEPLHASFARVLPPSEFRAKVRQCSALVAHAGMGSILTALEAGKPILVMPRRAELWETRNDHQVGTAARFAGLGRVTVAADESELAHALDNLEKVASSEVISPSASADLLAAIAAFLQGGSGAE